MSAVDAFRFPVGNDVHLISGCLRVDFIWFSVDITGLALRMPTLPIPSGAETAGIVAMYDVSDDWIPIYDKSSLPGYYMAIGTSGNQFKCTGPAGYLMASIIECVRIVLYCELQWNARSERLPFVFLPCRYVENGGNQDAKPLALTLPLTGHDIDTSFYSRLRKQSDQTSGTVMG